MKIINLVKNDKGEYVPENGECVPENKVKVRKGRFIPRRRQVTATQAFFDGIDIGLSFFEELQKRLIIISKLRGF